MKAESQKIKENRAGWNTDTDCEIVASPQT